MRTLLTRDERQMDVDRAADRLAYISVSFGLLAITAYRSLARDQAAWELLAVVILGGVVGWMYRAAHGVVDRRSALLAGLTFLAAAAVAVVVAMAVAR
jgi:hypothetical protein